MKRKPIDVDELKKVFRIMNGNLEKFCARTRKWNIVNNKANTPLGYCIVRFNTTMKLYHNIVWILITGKSIPKYMDVDHIDGDKLNNSIYNLRLVTHRENGQNRIEHRSGKLVGCSLDKRRNKYMSRIFIGKENVFIGYYKTEQEGNEAYTIACKHISDYKDNKSFRELVKKEMGGSRVGNNELDG